MRRKNPQPVGRAKGARQRFQTAQSKLWLVVKARPGFPRAPKASEKVVLIALGATKDFLINQADSGGANDKPN